jgi:hypothetical protein
MGDCKGRGASYDSRLASSFQRWEMGSQTQEQQVYLSTRKLLVDTENQSGQIRLHQVYPLLIFPHCSRWRTHLTCLGHDFPELNTVSIHWGRRTKQKVPLNARKTIRCSREAHLYAAHLPFKASEAARNYGGLKGKDQSAKKAAIARTDPANRRARVQTIVLSIRKAAYV